MAAKKPRPAHRPRRTDWQEKFLEAYGLMGIQTEACRSAGVHTATVIRERERDEGFAALFAEAEQKANGVLLRYLHERATSGQRVKRTETKTKPDGTVEVTVVETSLISTPALLALAKARMPEMFDDRLRVAHTGGDGGAIQIEALTTIDAAIARLSAELAERADGAPVPVE